MADRRAPARTAWLPAVIFGVITAVLVLAAAMTMFSAFMFYDDEGYVLISLRNFAEHGHLYGDVYSQYGPFPYVLYYLLHLAGFPFTHHAGRLLTLLAWSGSAILCSSLVWRATRSLALRLCVLAGVFVYLWVMVSEPTHPGGLIALLTAVLAYAGHRAIILGRVETWARWAGAVGAILALSKINIGAFALLAAAAWLLLHHENATVRRFAPAVLLAGIVALPLLLMRPLLSADWVQTYAVLFACAGIGAVGAVALGRDPRANNRAAFAGIVAAAIAAALVLAVVFARGTSVGDVLEGVLLRPMRHPVHFNLSFAWPAGAREAAAVSVVLFLLAWVGRRRGLARVDDTVAWLRIAGAVALAVVIARFPAKSPDNAVLSFAMPWLWLFLWPLAGEEKTAVAARSWVGLLFLGQCLHGFPVRGSQTAWGTFLALPLAALGAWQAMRWLAPRFPAFAVRRGMPRVALRTAVIAFALITTWRLVQVGGRYREGHDLGLPGAERVRLPDDATALFQLLTINAAVHGDVLFSLPGMYSFNFWSGLPTPTHANVTHWFSLLDPPEQQAIVRSLEAHPRACIIVQREHVDFISKHGFAPSGLINDYIAKNFTPAFTVGSFEFCVRRGRKIAPFFLGEILQRRLDPTGGKPDPENTLLTFTAALPAERAVASVEIVAVHDEALPPVRLGAQTARVEITPVTLTGDPSGPVELRGWPFAFSGAATVSVYFDAHGRRFPPDETLVVLRGVDGKEIASMRVKP